MTHEDAPQTQRRLATSSSAVEAELSEAREERVGLVEARDDARNKFARARDMTPRSPVFRARPRAAMKALAEQDSLHRGLDRPSRSRP